MSDALAVIRFALVGTALVLVCAVLRIPLGRRRLGAVILAAALGIFGYNALVFVALTMAPASDGALIVPTLIPVLTAVGALAIGERMWLAERPAPLQLAGGAVILAGVRVATLRRGAPMEVGEAA